MTTKTLEPISEHTFKAEDGGHDLKVRVFPDGEMVVRQGADVMVLSPADLDRLQSLRIK